MANFPFKTADPTKLPSTAPDAAMFDGSYPVPAGKEDRHDLIKAEFAPLFGDTSVYTRQFVGGWFFVHPYKGGPDQSVLFASSHPRADQPRYDWYQRGTDEIYLGFKVEGADSNEVPVSATPPVVEAAPVVPVVEPIPATPVESTPEPIATPTPTVEPVAPVAPVATPEPAKAETLEPAPVVAPEPTPEPAPAVVAAPVETPAVVATPEPTPVPSPTPAPEPTPAPAPAANPFGNPPVTTPTPSPFGPPK